MKKTALTPVLMSRVLIGLLLLGIILIGTGFYFAEQKLREIAITVNHAKIDNELAENEVQRLKILQSDLEENKDDIDRAASVVAEANSYQYQNQVVEVVNTYARQNGIRITSFDFPPSTAAGSTAVPAGLKKTAITINIEGPIAYENLMKFVRSIEQNLTKIQVSSLSLVRAENPSQISSSAVGLEVFIR